MGDYRPYPGYDPMHDPQEDPPLSERAPAIGCLLLIMALPFLFVGALAFFVLLLVHHATR